MSLLSCPARYLIAASLMLMSSTVCAQRSQGSKLDNGATEGPSCPQNWFLSHGYCLQSTSLPEGEARDYCEKQGGLLVTSYGVCISKATEDSIESTDSDTATPESSRKRTLVCPSGWKSYLGVCLLWPSDPAQICPLLGAQNLLGACIMRPGPVEIRDEFIAAVKRLDGRGDLDMPRSIRMCCCGSGLLNKCY